MSKKTGKEFASLAMNIKYNKYSYDELDCQAFVEMVLADLGVRKPDGTIYNWRGSNSMYRNYYSWRGTKEDAIEKFGGVPVGAFVYVWTPTGEEEKGYHDGLGNAQHVGIYCGGDLVRDSTRYKNSKGEYVRNGVGDAALKSFNRVTLPDMLDFSGGSDYNKDVDKCLALIDNIRKELNGMEDLLHDIGRD